MGWRRGQTRLSPGYDHPREYHVWQQIRHRCRYHKNYAGRGIKVCARWDSFESFIADMGPRPTDHHTIDRIDNDGDYEPSNCRWATRKEQALNRRSNRLITWEGQTKHLTVWAEHLNVAESTLRDRLKRHGVCSTSMQPRT